LSRDFEHIFGQIVSERVKSLLNNTNLVALKPIKIEKGSLPVDVRRSKTSQDKIPNTIPLRRPFKPFHWISRQSSISELYIFSRLPEG